MSAQHQHLEQLRTWFSQTIGRAYQTAWGVAEPAGATAEWQQICAYFGVPLLSDQERGEVRAAQRPTRGAAVMELSQVISAIVRQARVSLMSVDTSEAHPNTQSLQEQLRMLFERTERETVDAYKRAVLPQRVGMFGNVMAHHDGAAKQHTDAIAHSLLCRTCGAPRLNTTDFICPFCNQHMANPEQP